jgi:hypothetical protein
MKTEQPKRWPKRVVLGLVGLTGSTNRERAGNSCRNYKTSWRREDSSMCPPGHGSLYQDARRCADCRRRMASPGLPGGATAADAASHYALRA